MEYNLSQENNRKKQMAVERIKQMEQSYSRLEEEKRRTIFEDINIIDRVIKELELEIQQKEIERDIEQMNAHIHSLSISEISKNLINSKKSTNMPTDEYLRDKYMFDAYRDIIGRNVEVNYCRKQLDILTMKIKLLSLKKASRKIPKEQADMDMTEIQRELEETSEELQETIDSMAKAYKSYRRKVLLLPKMLGQNISEDQEQTINVQVTKLDQTEGAIPTLQQINDMGTELERKYLIPQKSSELPQPLPNKTKERMEIKGFTYLESKSYESFNMYTIRIRYANNQTKEFKVKVKKGSIPIIDNDKSRKLLVNLLITKGLIGFDSSNVEIEMGTIIMNNGKMIVKEDFIEAR